MWSFFLFYHIMQRSITWPGNIQWNNMSRFPAAPEHVRDQQHCPKGGVSCSNSSCMLGQPPWCCVHINPRHAWGTITHVYISTQDMPGEQYHIFLLHKILCWTQSDCTTFIHRPHIKRLDSIMHRSGTRVLTKSLWQSHQARRQMPLLDIHHALFCHLLPAGMCMWRHLGNVWLK